jgi:hypothetical protein
MPARPKVDFRVCKPVAKPFRVGGYCPHGAVWVRQVALEREIVSSVTCRSRDAKRMLLHRKPP